MAYRVFSFEHLEKIVEHFEKYPLQTQKRSDFYLFKLVVRMIKCGKHRNTEGLHEIINIKASLNKGLTENLRLDFPNVIPRSRPEVSNLEIKNPNWVRGFIEAEGCFSIYKPALDSSKVASFDISQTNGSDLIEAIKIYLNIYINLIKY